MRPLDKLTKEQWGLLFAVMLLIDSIILIAIWWQYTGLLDTLIYLASRGR